MGRTITRWDGAPANILTVSITGDDEVNLGRHCDRIIITALTADVTLSWRLDAQTGAATMVAPTTTALLGVGARLLQQNVGQVLESSSGGQYLSVFTSAATTLLIECGNAAGQGA